MPLATGRSRAVWTLPIVVVICAVMLLPAGTVLGAAGAHTPGLASSLRSEHAHAAAPRGAANVPGFSGLLPKGLAHPAVSVPSLSAPKSPAARLPVGDSQTPWWTTHSTSSAAGPSGAHTLVSPPNLALGLDRDASPSAVISPGYQAPPAPMGLADYGVNASSAYTYNTSAFYANVTFQSAPNATAPSTEALLEPYANPSLGFIDSPYDFSLQLNTIGSNLTIPGADNATIWAQNVLGVNNYSGYGVEVRMLDDVWNLSANSSFQFSSNAIAYGCEGANISELLGAFGGVYQCSAGYLFIPASAFPVSLGLISYLAVNPSGQDVLNFGVSVNEVHGANFTDYYDAIVFANPTGVAPVHAPVFSVNGFARAPYQPNGYPELLQDAEIVFGGPIGGSNSVFNSLNGSLQLEYETGAGGWANIPSAYNFGSDTGETAIGIVGTYSAGSGVETIHQGPSFLYGLWNSSAKIQAAPGWIRFQGSINESYGFVFVSNVAPGANGTNLSYVPTSAAGTFNTILPPAIPAGGLAYNTALYAAGDLPEVGANFSANTTGYAFPPSVPSAVIEAPLYMNGAAQAAGLAYNVSGRPLAALAPYNFSNLVVNLPRPFTHLNDYAYPSFVILQAQNLYLEVAVNNVSEGTNAPGGEIYTYDYHLPANTSGWDYPAPNTTGPWQNYTEEFDLFNTDYPSVQNESLSGSFRYGTPGDEGGTVYLFDDLFASVANISANNGSYGVAVEASYESHLVNLAASTGANAVTDIASSFTVAHNIAASGYFVNPVTFAVAQSLGVLAESAHSDQFYNLNATGDAYGFASGYYSPLGIYSIPGAYYELFEGVNATSGGNGFAASYLWDSTIAYLDFTDFASGGYLLAAYDVDVVGLYADGADGLSVYFSQGVSFLGYEEAYSEGTTVWAWDNYTNLSVGAFYDDNFPLQLEYDNDSWISDSWDAYGYGEGILVLSSNDTFVTNFAIADVQVDSFALGFGSDNVTVLDQVWINDTGAFGAGVLGAYDNDTSFLNLTIDDVAYEAVAVQVYGSNATSFDDTLVAEVHYNATGIELLGNAHNRLNGTTIVDTHDHGIGVEVADGFWTSLNGTTVEGVSYGGLGVALFTDILTWANGTEISDLNYTATGLAAIGDLGLWIDNLTASELGELSTGALVDGSGIVALNGTTVVDTDYLAIGVAAVALTDLSVQDTFGLYSWETMLIEATAGATVANTTIGPSYYGIVLNDSPAATVTNTSIYGAYYGVFVNSSADTSLQGTSVYGAYAGIAINHSASVSVVDTYANDDTVYGVAVNASNDVAITDLVANTTTTVGAYLVESDDAHLAGISANSSIGAVVVDSDGLQATEIAAWNGGGAQSFGLLLGRDAYANITQVDALQGGIGIWGEYDTQIAVTDLTADQAVGAMFNWTNDSVILGVGAEDGGIGVLFANDSVGDRVTDVFAEDGAIGTVFFGGSDDSAAGVFAYNLSLGVGTENSFGDVFTVVEAGDVSVGVAVLDSEQVTIRGVTAENTTLSSPWNASLLARLGLPVAAVVTEGDDVVSIANVLATDYPIALYDNGSADLTVSNLNATAGVYAVLLNGTEASTFTGISAYGDDIGLLAEGWLLGGAWFYALDNVVTTSQFVNDTSYGVAFGTGAVLNTVYDNDFVGDNGATDTYSAAHVQAFSWISANWFNSSGLVGNYWADWHTYADGVLAPYAIVGGGAWDYHPLGAPQGKVSVTFQASGLTSGTSWSVTLNGVTQSSTSGTIVFNVYPGTYSYSVGALAGWAITPNSGTVAPVSNAVTVTIGFATLNTVTFTASGLTSGTLWWVVFGGTPYSSTGATLTVATVAGTFAYSVVAPDGFTASPASGVLAVSGAASVTVTFRSSTPPVQMVAVTVEETGLPSGTTWTANVGGTTASGTTSSLTVDVPANASYRYTVSSANTSFTGAPGTGTITVLGAGYVLPVHFNAVRYAVTFGASGLPSGTVWSVVVDGTTYTTSGATVTVDLTNGTFHYSFGAVDGYTVGTPTGTGSVTGTPTGVSAAYTAVSPSPSPYVAKGTFNTDWAIAVGVAVLGVLIGLVALVRKPKAPMPPPAQPWTEGPTGRTPAASSSSAAPPAGGKPGA